MGTRTLLITLRVTGDDVDEAEDHVDHLLNAGAIQDLLHERAGDHDHEIEVTSALCTSMHEDVDALQVEACQMINVASGEALRSMLAAIDPDGTWRDADINAQRAHCLDLAQTGIVDGILGLEDLKRWLVS